jgi:replicative DNA helicase
MDDLEAIAEGKKQVRIRFGFSDLDGMTGGAKAGDLVLIADRPSQGRASAARRAKRSLGALDGEGGGSTL